jgi:hypothetical protein
MKIMDFFGIDLDQTQFDVNYYVDLLKASKQIRKDRKIKQLIVEFNPKHPIVCIAKRQLLIKTLRPLINSKLSIHDEYWYIKEVNTSSDHDRLYGAEEKLLQLGLVLATGKVYRRLLQNKYKPSVKTLRAAQSTHNRGRFDYFWQILNKETKDYIMRYKRGELTGGNPSKQTEKKAEIQLNNPEDDSGSIIDKLCFWKNQP